MLSIKLFHDPWCEIGGDCIPVDDIVELLQTEFSHAQVEVLTMDEDVESVVRHGIMNTPALVIDGRLEFHGTIERETLRTRLQGLSS